MTSIFCLTLLSKTQIGLVLMNETFMRYIHSLTKFSITLITCAS
jgi:hypothetical protein